jgi:hypothetical protein
MESVEGSVRGGAALAEQPGWRGCNVFGCDVWVAGVSERLEDAAGCEE